jgi:hypothetical protein
MDQAFKTVTANDLPISDPVTEEGAAGAIDFFAPLLSGPVRGLDSVQAAQDPPRIDGVVIGELLAIAENAQVPLIRYPGQPGSAALEARSSVDLHRAHIGAAVVLMFEHGEASRPIVIGVLRNSIGWPAPERPVQVEVDVGGERLVISAREQLVLRCGKASITLTKAGKVLIEGSYLLSRSTGVNRIKGGAVQLN